MRGLSRISHIVWNAYYSQRRPLRRTCCGLETTCMMAPALLVDLHMYVPLSSATVQCYVRALPPQYVSMLAKSRQEARFFRSSSPPLSWSVTTGRLRREVCPSGNLSHYRPFPFCRTSGRRSRRREAMMYPMCQLKVCAESRQYHG